MDLPSGTWRHVNPADAETDLLKQYLKRHKQVIPPNRVDILRAVRNHLARSGRQTLIVKTRDGPMTSVISKISNLFTKTQSDTRHYEQPPQHGPTHRRENFQNIRNQTLSISPVEPVRNLNPVDSRNYETDSLNSQINRSNTNFAFPPPPEFNPSAAGNVSVGARSDSFFSDSLYEDQRQEPIYATPTMFNPASPQTQKITFEKNFNNPEELTKIMKPKILTENVKPPVLTNFSTPGRQPAESRSKLNTKFTYKFKAQDCDIAEYLSAVERYAENMHLTQSETIFLALANFERADESNLCAESLSSEEKLNWELFKQALINKLGKTCEDYWELFENTTRKSSESPQTFLSKLTIFYKKANEISTLSESHKAEIVRRFRKGINPQLKCHLDAINATDYATIANLSRRLERAHGIPCGFSARVNNIQFPALSSAGDQSKKSEPQNSPKTPNFKNSSQTKTKCPVCSKLGHSAKFCFFNPLSQKYRGAAWVETELAKMSKN